jgi:hypothetical protein
MMPAIINSFTFNEQTTLVLRAVPLQNQFARFVEMLDDAANRIGMKVGPSNLPGSTGSRLFTLQ